MKLKLIEKATEDNPLVTYGVTKKGLTLLRRINSMVEMLKGKQPISLYFFGNIYRGKGKSTNCLISKSETFYLIRVIVVDPEA